MSAPHHGRGESVAPDPGAPPCPHLRPIEPDTIARGLAELLELPKPRVTIALRAGWYPEPPPPLVPSVDVEAWLSWALAGLPAFRMGMPSYNQARDAGVRAVLVISLARAGDNLTEVERTLGTYRKVLRNNLRRFGLYPLQGTASGLLGGVTETWDGIVVAACAGATAAGLHRLLGVATGAEKVELRRAVEIVERLGWMGG